MYRETTHQENTVQCFLAYSRTYLKTKSKENFFCCTASDNNTLQQKKRGATFKGGKLDLCSETLHEKNLSEQYLIQKNTNFSSLFSLLYQLNLQQQCYTTEETAFFQATAIVAILLLQKPAFFQTTAITRSGKKPHQILDIKELQKNKVSLTDMENHRNKIQRQDRICHF